MAVKENKSYYPVLVPITEDKDSVYLSDGDVDKLKEIADRRGLSMRVMVSIILSEYVLNYIKK